MPTPTRRAEPYRLLTARRPPAGATARRGVAGVHLWPTPGSAAPLRWSRGEPAVRLAAAVTAGADVWRGGEPAILIVVVAAVVPTVAAFTLTDRPLALTNQSEA